MIILSLVIPIFLAVRVWKQFRGIFRAAACSLETLQDHSFQPTTASATLRGPGASLDPEVITQAHQIRSQIRNSRWERRQARWQAARNRWKQLGLVK